MSKRDDVLRILTAPIAGEDGFELEPDVAEKGIAAYEAHRGCSVNDDDGTTDAIAVTIYDLFTEDQSG